MADIPEARTLRVIVNGKAAADAALRQAVRRLREEGVPVEVRVTWEQGDAARYAAEASRDECDVVVAAGGDGTINEVVNGLMSEPPPVRTAVAVCPYGTANDFATGCGIPVGDPLAALRLAARQKIRPIDVGRANDRYFINVASGGFGAEVTTSTPPDMKRLLGGAAYSLMGMVTAMKLTPYRARLVVQDQLFEGQVIIMAVANGRQCGGGFRVAPNALLDDGLLDVMVVHDVDIPQMGMVFHELTRLGAPGNRYVEYHQLAEFTIESTEPLQWNLDGEPMRVRRCEFSTCARSLSFVLPDAAPLKG